MKITVNAVGDACPIPVVKTQNALSQLNGAAGTVETLVDNEIAVQNVTKLTQGRGHDVKSVKISDGEYRVEISVKGDGAVTASPSEDSPVLCTPDRRRNTVVVISSSCMGAGDDVLGAALMKSYIFALSQQEELPKTILFYNGGAKLTCEDAPTLEDLHSLEAQGVEILTCGTCLNHYGLTDSLKVGEVTNMYVIAEKMAQADLLVKP